MTNVVLLVLDACRFDGVTEQAQTVRELGSDNIWFENAIALGDWSHPSHASLFTGQYPASHGACAPLDPMPDLTLVQKLSERGYTTYGVSANKFAGPDKGFDEPFDEFVNTFPFSVGCPPARTGIDVSELIQESTETSTPRRYAGFLREALSHQNPTDSLYNLAVEFGRRVARNSERVRALHPLLHPNHLFAYDPEDNTASIEQLLADEAETDSSFFIFANYADTHRPYAPPAEHQRAVFGDSLPFSRVQDLNEDVASEWRFLERVATDTLDESDLEQIRDLYAAEVHSVDTHVKRVLEMLEAHGLREDTMVIVTADHGENLGEVDGRGERRMCHMESVSDHLLNVPLVIAHPDIDDAVVEQHVSLRTLFDVCLDGGESLLTTDDYIDYFTPEDGVVFADCPARYSESNIRARFPDVPPEIVHKALKIHTVVAYEGDWKIAVDSEGDGYAWRDGERSALEAAPAHLKDRCQEHLESLPDVDAYQNDNIVGQTRSQLEQLGYL